MKNRTLLLLLFISMISFPQEIIGDELLEKAIQFHDPNGNGETFEGALFVTTQITKGTQRKSSTRINLPEKYFSVKSVRDTIITTHTVRKGLCSLAINRDKNPSEKQIKKFSLNCEPAKMYKNY